MKSIQFILLIAISACSALEGEQKTNVNDIIKSHEIKKVTKTEILERGQKLGLKIHRIVEKADLCDPVLFEQTLKSVSDTTQSKITLGFSRSDFETQDEKGLWEAYEYNSKNDISSESAVQILGDKVLFSAPLLINPLDSYCVTEESVGMWSILIPIKSVINSL